MEMHDIFKSFKTRTAQLGDYRVEDMLLSPRHWKKCKLSVNLNWTATKFIKGNSSSVPKNKKGVYSFVVKPGVANHVDVAYLLYVGKVEKQSFRDRYQQYLGHFKQGEKSRWFHVATFLNKWQEYLWFYWAPIQKTHSIGPAETKLISSFLPPMNHSYKGTVKKEVKLALNR